MCVKLSPVTFSIFIDFYFCPGREDTETDGVSMEPITGGWVSL